MKKYTKKYNSPYEVDEKEIERMLIKILEEE